jgi:hypothetical protein
LRALAGFRRLGTLAGNRRAGSHDLDAALIAAMATLAGRIDAMWPTSPAEPLVPR